METSQSSRKDEHPDISSCLDMLDAIAAVATNSRPVYLVARRGTGPLFLAEAIHRASLRGARKFALVRCGLSPPSTVNSQLFGARPSTRRKSSRLSGKILEADGGTLFVEQVQNASPEAQRAFLQILEEHEFTAGGVTRPVDLRIIVSASESLEKHVAEQRFRADLYYRLNAMPILIPPAMRNREDIMGLLAAAKGTASETVWHTTQGDPHIGREVGNNWRRLMVAVRSAGETLSAGASPEELLSKTLTELSRIPYPTHRQLESLVMGAATQCIAGPSIVGGSTYDALTVEFQRALIQRALAECNGILSCAAAILGLTIPELKARLDNMGMSQPPC